MDHESLVASHTQATVRNTKRRSCLGPQQITVGWHLSIVGKSMSLSDPVLHILSYDVGMLWGTCSIVYTFPAALVNTMNDVPCWSLVH
jgi:hypothetical protein